MLKVLDNICKLCCVLAIMFSFISLGFQNHFKYASVVRDAYRGEISANRGGTNIFLSVTIDSK